MSAAVCLGGCTIGGSTELRSLESGAVLRPDLPLVVYAARDANTADIYLTDLTPAELDPGVPLSELTGNIVHVHLFLVARAGRTPIEDDACTVTIRHAVLARGAMGVYGGGGFLLPDGRPGAGVLRGSIDGTTLRLTECTPGFADRLGVAAFRASIAAPRDDGLARNVAARLEDVVLAIAELHRADAPASP